MLRISIGKGLSFHYLVQRFTYQLIIGAHVRKWFKIVVGSIAIFKLRIAVKSGKNSL